jgi:hypothetical protein
MLVKGANECTELGVSENCAKVSISSMYVTYANILSFFTMQCDTFV